VCNLVDVGSAVYKCDENFITRVFDSLGKLVILEIKYQIRSHIRRTLL